MREKELERKLKKAVEERGGACLKLSSAFCVGLPDRLVLLPQGKATFVETKARGKKPSAVQLARHETLKNLGFRVVVLDNEKSLDELLQKNAL